MDIVTASPSSGSPFHNHDVREWSRLDSITGVLERARLETDRWTANTATTSHKYNKVVDSRARSGADGNLQQARRKLEVFQSQVPGGRIQVIKTQTVSSNRWTSQGIASATNGKSKDNHDAFEDLKLSLNPLDLTSEKAKASVGRGVGRRPPSRSRIRDDILARNSNLHSTATINLHRVSRLCHQIHNSAVKQTFGKNTTCADSIEAALPIDERESGDGVEIVEIADEHEPPVVKSHTNLSRTRSTSSEDFFEKRKSLEDLEDLEQLQTWRRTSKLRRSLQYPKLKEAQPSKPPDLPPTTGSVRKIREDLETGRRLSTALRGNNVDLDALDQILKSISNSSISSAQSDAKSNDSEADGAIITAKKQQKRNSFVTVESIQAVRDKLRRTGSPTISACEQEEEKNSRDEDDDGIVTDRPVTLKQFDNSGPSDSVNMSANTARYNYSGEREEKKNNISGTGSLESRNKFNNYNKQDDWFARRKSYGFEQMQQPHAGGSDSLKNNKNRNESSTDSGICRSTEIVVVSPPSKVNANRREFDFNDVIKDDNVTNVKKYAMIFENKNENKNGIKNAPRSNEAKRHSIAVDESKYMNNTREDNHFKRTSLVINDNNTNKDDENKKTNKKVEFCKTEVHFAADSGRVNIVETDEKPPPTQRFRRRRRNSGPSEDYSRNGLPVQHFGDSTYEKFLFGDSADEPSNGIYENVGNSTVPILSNNGQSNLKISANVTVNAVNGNYVDIDEEPQKDNENEAPRGILKNKPIKPRPFLLGTKNIEESWAPNSRPDQDPSMWKPPVTLTAQRAPGDEKEFQKLRHQLRPTNRRLDYSSEDNSTHVEDKGYHSALKDMRVLSPPIDERCSSWSVADRIKQVEELKWTENKGYSTKVNFGDGEATVVENKHTTWPRKDEYKEVKKRNALNKSLVVRIGQQDDNTNTVHKVCSKTMTNNVNGLTTTTKITIDLSPSPTTAEKPNDFKFPRATIQTFKSPSLIMNTFARSDCVNGGSVFEKPKLAGLEDLKQMYEDAHSDAEADKEVHRILMNSTEEHQSSVASGSWSKMRAFKQVHSYDKTHTARAVNGSHNHTLIEKESSKNTINDKSYKYKLINDQIEQDLKYLNQEVENLNFNNRKSSISKSPLNNYHHKLSSPFLVGQSRSRTNSLSSDPESSRFDKKDESPKFSRRDPSPNRYGPSVLRQPKKSEMAYFGINTSTTAQKKTSTAAKTSKLSEKPDLLQFNNNDMQKKSSYISAAPTSAPIYENMVSKNSKTKSTFDRSILDELTKAADEILLAVNGYTDEERRMSTDDEMRSHRRTEKLDTITENKSWKQSSRVTSKSHTSQLRNEKHKSSNSSIDSITRDVHRSFEQLDRNASNKAVVAVDKIAEQRMRKKVTNEPTNKITTKARRLQRANSREALLHSQGSSSEDLPNHVEIIRKPRMIKRTKTAQLSVTATGLEMKKPTRNVPEPSVVHKSKHVERTQSNLPEIRHKTAVSTIRSTAEKQAASRERARLRSEETKKRQSATSTVKRETSKVMHNSKSVDRSKRNKVSDRHTAKSNETTKKFPTRSDVLTSKH